MTGVTRTGGPDVVVRPLERSDAPQLAALFGRLSPDSRYLRYLAPVRALPAAHLRHLADVDHRDHEAVGVFAGGELVGAAHWFRAVPGGAAADLAVEVADSHQRCGLGALLVQELAERAAGQGISRFTAFTSSENHGVLGLLRHAPWPSVVRVDGPETSIELALSA